MATSYVQHLYLGFYWLAMSNSMVNPIIYYWMNGKWVYTFNDKKSQETQTKYCSYCSFIFRFRIYFQQIICFCCLRIWRSRTKKEEPGILVGKNSQSEMGRSRSCEFSMHDFLFPLKNRRINQRLSCTFIQKMVSILVEKYDLCQNCVYLTENIVRRNIFWKHILIKDVTGVKTGVMQERGGGDSKGTKMLFISIRRIYQQPFLISFWNFIQIFHNFWKFEKNLYFFLNFHCCLTSKIC